MSIARTVSSIDPPRPCFTSDLKAEQVATRAHDLITFLATSQVLRVEILPISWQATRPRLGTGATSQIDQAVINLQAVFAFKRVADFDKTLETEDAIYKTFTREITVLSHPLIQTHPNMVKLQGICWDVLPQPKRIQSGDCVTFSPTSTHKVWPVLVFEKSHFNDLYHFVSLPLGKALDTVGRLKLCETILTAVLDMHSYGIIHGDIKPENVLIFEDAADIFHAKIADFGYSTCYTTEDELISVPRSRPWHAPEHTFSGVRPFEARNMDIYSLGMLILWFVFESSLPNIYFTSSAHQHDKNLMLLEIYKNSNSLIRLACQLLSAEGNLDHNKKTGLRRLFCTCLDPDPVSRGGDLQLSLTLLGWKHTVSPTPSLFNQENSPLDYEFELPVSAAEIYRCDYQVRNYIFDCMQRRSETSHSCSMAFQLAICYTLGFGCTSSGEKAQELLGKSLRRVEDLNQALQQIQEFASIPQNKARTIWTDLGRLATAESVIRQELKTLKQVYAYRDFISMQQSTILGSLLTGQARWNEAEKLTVQVLESSYQMYGEDSNFSLRISSNLAIIYSAQKRWEEAERLLVRAVYKSQQIYGEHHMETLESMSALASLYEIQGRWSEVEAIAEKMIESGRQTLGDDHHRMLVSKLSLMSSYLTVGRLPEAEELGLELLGSVQERFGPNHHITLDLWAVLAELYEEQGRRRDAEQAQVFVMENRIRVLGKSHPSTLASMTRLRRKYLEQARWAEAKKLYEEVQQNSRPTLGEEDSSKPTSSANEYNPLIRPLDMGMMSKPFAIELPTTELAPIEIEEMELARKLRRDTCESGCEEPQTEQPKVEKEKYILRHGP